MRRRAACGGSPARPVSSASSPGLRIPRSGYTGGREWSRSPAAERAARLERAADLLEAERERFIALASATVAKRIAEINYIDMRYTNGFSVGWSGRSSLARASEEDAAPDG